MNRGAKWGKKLSNGFLHERTVFFSLAFLLVVLSLDCFLHSLPVSGYGLVLATLVVAGCTTCGTCHGIKWAITSGRPLAFRLGDDKWGRILRRWEENFFRRVLSRSFESFEYPTSLNEQTRLLLKDIERDFVKTWYSEISQNPSFLFDSHLILEEIFFKIIKKVKAVNFKHVILSILILYLNHLQEYKKSVKKMVRLSHDEDAKPKVELKDICRYTHPGSQSDQVLNYFLKKVTKAVLKEFAPHEFANSLECKILSGIIGRKLMRRLLTTIEDPNWINIKLIYILSPERHKELLDNKVYVVKEKPVILEEEEFRFRKPALLSKRYLSPNLFDGSRNLFDRNGFHGPAVENGDGPRSKTVDRGALALPLRPATEEAKGNISTVLSGLIPSTAGPLLPDNISVRYQALNKMWQSPVTEVLSESITNSLRKVFCDGPKEKKLTRSKSIESMADLPGSLRNRDVSFGEELCEIEPSEMRPAKKLTKTRSFDSESLALDDVVDRDGGSPVDTSPGPRDVSPVYEEPEDFATTIAKLRSLLQQRESSSTLSDKSNLSIDSQSAGFSADKSDSSNLSQAPEGEAYESRAAGVIPADGRLFLNVSVPRGELAADAAGAAHVLYSIQYDGIYMLKDNRKPGVEPELVLQTTVVKRRFREFVRLQTRLEESEIYGPSLKGIKGPSRWSRLAVGEPAATPGRRAVLETFLREVCAKPELSQSPELQEFLAYGQGGVDAFEKKDPESSLQRIDKMLANKVTGVFNSIKTVLPSFDFDSTALVATNDTVRAFHDQKLLQGFLNFGNKSEFFELTLNFAVREPTGESLTDDIRRYFSEKSDCIEDAVDVLDSNDWLSEQRECRFISAEEKCVWHGHKEAVLDDELEPLDSWLPVYSLLLDILCELLQDSDSWAIKEPVVRLLKVLSGHWERRLQEKVSALDWDRISANVIRLLRAVVFQTEGGDAAELEEEHTREVLKDVILGAVPGWATEFVTAEGVASAVNLFVDSFQQFRVNRDFLLRVVDILLVHLLSCHHLSADSAT